MSRLNAAGMIAAGTTAANSPAVELPAPSELASLVQAAGSDHAAPEAVAALHAMIEDSEAARTLYRELMTAREGEPSPFQLLHLLYSVDYPYEPPPDATALQWLIAQSSEARELVERLEVLACEAGLSTLKGRSARQVIVSHHQLDQLLAAEDDWRHPDDVLDPVHYIGIYPVQMLAICTARLARARGTETRRLTAVRAKLARPAQLESLRPRHPSRLERLDSWLRELDGVDDAVDSLEDLARLLRYLEAD